MRTFRGSFQWFRERERDAQFYRTLDNETNSVDTLALDFDGTLTDMNKEAEGFVEGYKTGAARELGISKSELDTYWGQAVTEIQQNPSKYGWKFNGKIVATATSDPIVTCHSALELVAIKLGKDLGGEQLTALTDKLFHENYEKMGIAFRAEANAFLLDVYNLFGSRVYIVTNSSTDKVKAKISKLPSDHSRIKVVGGAKKFVVDDAFNGVPEKLEVNDLERPVYLRRRNYYEVLDGIVAEAKTTRNGIVVVGDIWELDLALPQYLGMAVGQFVRDTTPEFERKAVANYKRGFTANNLSGIYQNLRRLRIS